MNHFFFFFLYQVIYTFFYLFRLEKLIVFLFLTTSCNAKSCTEIFRYELYYYFYFIHMFLLGFLIHVIPLLFLDSVCTVLKMYGPDLHNVCLARFFGSLLKNL